MYITLPLSPCQFFLIVTLLAVHKVKNMLDEIPTNATAKVYSGGACDEDCGSCKPTDRPTSVGAKEIIASM